MSFTDPPNKPAEITTIINIGIAITSVLLQIYSESNPPQHIFD